MNGKKKILNALDHRDGPVPLDIGATAVTGMHVNVVGQLRSIYGLGPGPVKVTDPYQMLGEIDAELAAALGVDTVGVSPRSNMFGFENHNWKEWRTPWGQTVLVGENFHTSPAADGGLLIYPGGDRDAQAAGHMPQGGFFFDAIIRQGAVDEDNLRVEDNTEEFTLLDEDTLDYFKAEIDRAAGTDRAVVATMGGLAFGDIAMVPAPFLKNPRGVRDIASWYMATATDPEFIRKVFDFQLEVALENLERFRRRIGNAIDVMFICGTDFGTQTSSFCSTDTYMELYHPYYRQINDWIHSHTTWKTFKHSCGAVADFMPCFIRSGFDIINPVQCSALGMEPKRLKAKYGNELTFWGGGIDTQKVLPFGSADEVKQQVWERCEIFARDGGFVFDAIHNIQANVPVENAAAMFEALKEYNGVR